MQPILNVNQEVNFDNRFLARVLIYVEGGIVQAVYASQELDLQVYDLDIPSFATQVEIEQMKTLSAEFNRQVSGLKQIY